MILKNKTLWILFGLLVSVKAVAQIPNGYYNNAQNTQGFALKNNLHQIISKHSISWHYGDLPSYYQQTDRDLYYENDSSMLDIYSENPTGPDPYNYWYANNSIVAGASTEGEGWNREHTYSQSFFYGNYPMYSDLHFVVPTDARVNQARSNFPFGIVGNSPTFTSLSGTKRGPANMPGYTNTVTEPIDEFKGDIARMLMYVAVRYENLIPYFQYTNVRNPIDSLSEKAFKNWYINMLLTWHQNDPVSQKEIDRNNAVFAIQGNRNPFVDHPEYAQTIWGNLSSSNDIPEKPYQIQTEQIGAQFISINWPFVQDPDVLGFEVYLNDTKIGTTAATHFTLHHLTPATAYDIKVRSYSKSYVNSPFTSLNNISTLSSDTFSRDLFISKLIVGSGNNKAIEITNNTGYIVDLRDYYVNIRQENNSTGSLYWSSNKIQLEGQLAHNKKLVILNPLAALSCFSTDSADILSNASPMQLDGKMAIELSFKNNTLDRIGNSIAIEDYAANKSLYRKDSIHNPSSSFDINEWVEHPLDYCEDLGNVYESNSIVNIKKTQNKKFEIFPNPNQNGRIFIKGEAIAKVQEVTVLSMDGSKLATFKQPFIQKNNLQLPNNIKGLLLLVIDGVAYPILVQ